MAGIFKAYDIRGVYLEDLDENMAYRIGRAYARFLHAGRVAVGRDMRTSSPSLAQATMDGLKSTGATVFDLGLVTTPMTYFAVGKLQLDGGLMVTASHNPHQYNGFKLCREKAIPISGDTGIGTIERMVREDPEGGTEGDGRIVQKDVLAEYTRHVLAFANRNVRTLKIVLDTANGMGGKVLPEILKELPVDVVPLYFELDGTFPNHEANPLKEENLLAVRRTVRETGADLGVAIDGDGDRCAYVDEKGDVVTCDIMTALIAKEILASEGPSAVVYDLRSSWTVPEEIKAMGGTPIEERVGHSFIKATMRRHDAAFGGELSGHYYFRDNYYADSAAIALVHVLNIVGSAEGSFSDTVKPLRRYYATGEMNFEVRDKDGIIARIKEQFSDAHIKELDGLSVSYPDWWFNIRKSNTEPLLRLNLEGRTRELMERGRARVLALLA